MTRLNSLKVRFALVADLTYLYVIRVFAYLGLTIDRGFMSPYFVKDTQRQVCEMPAARILITDKKITAVQDILPVLEHLAKSKEPLFIAADDISSMLITSINFFL
jgi:chaperonin GroEL (HSP60 family)